MHHSNGIQHDNITMENNHNHHGDVNIQGKTEAGLGGGASCIKDSFWSWLVHDGVDIQTLRKRNNYLIPGVS